MMTCSRDGVADCGMAGRVQSAGKVASGWGAFHLLHTQSEEGSCICHCSKQADEGRSEPLPGCTDSGAPSVQRRRHVPAVLFRGLASGRYLTGPVSQVCAACTTSLHGTASRYGPGSSGRRAALPWSSHS